MTTWASADSSPSADTDTDTDSAGMDFGGHFGGHHSDVHFAGDFGGFGHGFTVQTAVHASNRKIVPLPPTASVVNTSITYDENGELHVRPFDDEDLFVED